MASFCLMASGHSTETNSLCEAHLIWPITGLCSNAKVSKLSKNIICCLPACSPIQLDGHLCAHDSCIFRHPHGLCPNILSNLPPHGTAIAVHESLWGACQSYTHSLALLLASLFLYQSAPMPYPETVSKGFALLHTVLFGRVTTTTYFINKTWAGLSVL